MKTSSLGSTEVCPYPSHSAQVGFSQVFARCTRCQDIVFPRVSVCLCYLCLCLCPLMAKGLIVMASPLFQVLEPPSEVCLGKKKIPVICKSRQKHQIFPAPHCSPLSTTLLSALKILDVTCLALQSLPLKAQPSSHSPGSSREHAPWTEQVLPRA